MDTLKNVIDSREQQLKELKSFTDAVNKQIADITKTLGWTLESVTNVDQEHLTCPYDSSHRLTKESFNDHLASCQWKAEGYDKLDIPLSESTLANSPFSTKFDKKLQDEVLRKAKEQNPTMRIANYECVTWWRINILKKCEFLTLIIGMGERLIPCTSDRLLTDFTSDERRALYDYVVANTVKPDIGQDIADIKNLKPQEKKDRELSFLELLAQERNLKRRRAKHRGVHTNKKSHTEILREVISQQMEIYTDYICEQTNSEHAIDIQNTKMDNANYETTQDKTEQLYKVFHTSPQKYNDSNFREKNDRHYNKRDESKKERSEKKNYYRERSRDRQERYSDGHNKTYRRSEHRKSSHSRDRKSYKKDRHRSKDRHKDKHKEKKHRSKDREKSLEKHMKHTSYRGKEKRNKEH